MKYTIIFNTDGEPYNGWNSNEKFHFERELKQLISSVPCDLIFNIITDEEKVVEYYNDLDINLNKGNTEMTPVVDVIDDLKSIFKYKANLEYIQIYIKKGIIKSLILDIIDCLLYVLYKYFHQNNFRPTNHIDFFDYFTFFRKYC